jgi:glycosyltransferase involved in cell wall biosynthesis
MSESQDPMSVELPAAAQDAEATVSNADLLRAIESLRHSVELSARQTERLAAAMTQALARLEQGGSTPQAVSNKKTINWVIGPPDNIGWAYGNNAKRLSERLGSYRHMISASERCDVAVYFDAIVADRYPAQAKKSILRIGGPRPLDRLYGENIEAMRDGFLKFDAIIALNGELYQRALKAHRNVHLIPNALDLKEWHPSKLTPNEGRTFTVGFAASLKSSAEAEIKGLDIALAAAARIGAPVLQTSKGSSQIPHERMIADFYSKIDVLVCPVAPGREGTSNVIMEALALGIPVVTTVDAGYHGEFLVDGKHALIRERSELMFAEALATLQRDPRMRRRIGNDGRSFAERHHDLSVVSRQYAAIIGGARSTRAPAKTARKKIAFVPFWEPVENFGSSRLRAKYPAEFLARAGQVEVSLGYDPTADIVIVIQSCSDQIMQQLHTNTQQFVIYDVCDKYYENPRLFKHLDPPVDSLARFHELAGRADLLLTPSRELKADIASRLPMKPVKHVVEPVDYGTATLPCTPVGNKIVLWYGNPDRGNFESSKWMIDQLCSRHGFQPLIVSRRSFFKQYPDYLPYCVDWSLEAMAEAFFKAGVCVLAHDQAEQAKSPNRFVAAIMHGVPTLVHQSPGCAEILSLTGHDFAVIKSERDLDRSIGKLGSTDFRELFVRRVQRHLNNVYGEKAIAATYADVFTDYSYARSVFSSQPRRVAFVSHNLAVGEGAPWSLLELVSGLAGNDIAPFTFSAANGPLLTQYRKAELSVELFDLHARHTVKVLNTQYANLSAAFAAFLKANEIEAVVCNTVKAAPFAAIARQHGIPATVIVRESYSADERFSHFTGDARLAAITGLCAAEHVVFVAQSSLDAWADQPFGGRVHVIPNGISPARFAEDAAFDQAQARQQLGLPADKIIALCVGTINTRKGQREIMEAFADMPAEFRSRVQLVFLGAVENSQLSDFRRSYAALAEPVREQISVIEATDRVTLYYRAADIFLMNSSSEAYPRSIVEGLYFGLPALSTPVFGVKEQIRDGETGLLYEFGDMAAWKSGLTRLVDEPGLRERMSAAAARSFWMLTGYNEMLMAYKAIIADMLRS